MRFLGYVSCCLAFFLFQALATATADDVHEDFSPAELRLLWQPFAPGLKAVAKPFDIPPNPEAVYGGTFGLDVSHHNTDRSLRLCGCRDERRDCYERMPSCSCEIDWKSVRHQGMRFVFLKATQGASWTDWAFLENWKKLSSLPDNSKIFYGAYHFLSSNGSGTKQVENFLRLVGGGEQIRPVLDVEWDSQYVSRTEYNRCPSKRRRTVPTRNGTRFICDMWYRRSPAQIVRVIEEWAGEVENRLKQKPIIYTNKSWWESYVGSAGLQLMENYFVWIARYPLSGKPRWLRNGKPQNRWGMPPLPKNASYPAGMKYESGHVWQFTEDGRFNRPVRICAGTPRRKSIDVNWYPAEVTQFEKFMTNTQ